MNIVFPAGASVPRGVPLLVELRDTSLQDAPSVTLMQLRSTVPRALATSVRVTLDLESVADGTTVWVHLDADRDGRVSHGDYITVESYPVTRHGSQEMTVRLKQV